MISIKKFVVAIGFFFTLLQGSFSSDLLSRLNAILKTKGPVYIITVTRGWGNILREGEFEGYEALEPTKFKALLRLIKQTCDKHENSLKIIVFNEYFFGKYPVLREEKKNNFVQLIFGANCLNTIFYPNFLYQKECSKNFIAEDLKPYIKENNHEYILSIIEARRIFSNAIKYIDDDRAIMKEEAVRALGLEPPSEESDRDIPIPKLPKVTNIDSIVRNITYGIYKKDILSEYKKSSYFRECDYLLGNAIYDFGDGKDRIRKGLTEDLKDIAKRLIQTISTEICYDLACGIRKNNEWKNDGGKRTVLHLIQSNSIDPLTSEDIEKLPSDKLIVHVDPTKPHSASQDIFDTRTLIPSFFDKEKTSIVPVDSNAKRVSIERVENIILNDPDRNDKISLMVWKISDPDSE